MGHLELTKVKKAPVFRKMAMGIWKTPCDPSAYGVIDIDMTRALEFMKNYGQEHAVRVTPTHLVAKAVAHLLRVRPEINGLIRGKHIYLRKNVDLFLQVNIPGQTEDVAVKEATLSGLTIFNADQLTLAEIAQYTGQTAQSVRSKKDRLNTSMSTMKWVPWWAMGCFLRLTSFILYDLNRTLPIMGLKRDPFGSAMITNLGSFGIERAWAPLVPFSRVPILFAMGAITDRPWVADGKLCIRPIMSIGVTLDHRFIDGVHAGQLHSELKKCFENPEEYLAPAHRP